MTKEETLLSKHLMELAARARSRGYTVFSDFLGLNEQNIFYHSLSALPNVSYVMYGGYEYAERQMIAFIPDAPYTFEDIQSEFPILDLSVRLPRQGREELTHRDYLGSLMNLGIDRTKIGDILVHGEGAEILCEERMADYLSSELSRVRHTAVNCKIIHPSEIPDAYLTARTSTVQGTVASIRPDSLIAMAFGGSRSSISPLIDAGKVFVNGKQITSAGVHLKEGDIISVRGLGKMRFVKEEGETRKGRVKAVVERYI